MKKKDALAVYLLRTTRKNRGARQGEALGLFLGGALILLALYLVTYVAFSLLTILFPIPHLLRVGLGLMAVTAVGGAYMRYGRETRKPGVSLLLPASSSVLVNILFAGPRLIEEAQVSWSLARDERALDVKSCVAVLARLMSRDEPIQEPEVREVIEGRSDPDLVIRQLLTFEGVLQLHSTPPGLTLTKAFRSELIEVCRLAKFAGGEEASAE